MESSSQHETERKIVSASNNSSRDDETAGGLAEKQSDVSSQSKLVISSGNSTSDIEAIISGVMENILQPYMDRLQHFESRVENKVSQIDDTVRNLQTAVNNLSKDLDTVLQNVKVPKKSKVSEGELSSQGSSMQSIHTPKSCMSAPATRPPTPLKYQPQNGSRSSGLWDLGLPVPSQLAEEHFSMPEHDGDIPRSRTQTM